MRIGFRQASCFDLGGIRFESRKQAILDLSGFYDGGKRKKRKEKVARGDKMASGIPENDSREALPSSDPNYSLGTRLLAKNRLPLARKRIMKGAEVVRLVWLNW